MDKKTKERVNLRKRVMPSGNTSLYLATDNKVIKFNTTLPESAKQSLSLNSYSGFTIPINH